MAQRADEQDRQLGGQRQDLAEDLDRCGVGPVDVLADEDERAHQPRGHAGADAAAAT